MQTQIVVLDACVIFPSQLRSFFMHLAVKLVYEPRWTDVIHEEWSRNLRQQLPDITNQQVASIISYMNIHAPKGTVTGYEFLIPTLSLPDPNDRHVLAAAIHAKAALIVTFNLVDFPASVLSQFGIRAIHPDDFALELLQADPSLVFEACTLHRASLTRPAKSLEEYLATLEIAGLSAFVAALRQLQVRL
jgi:predicted nucleic acid-binding protein